MFVFSATLYLFTHLILTTILQIWPQFIESPMPIRHHFNVNYKMHPSQILLR